MSEPGKLNMPDSMVEQLRCSLCNGYLSCAPIMLLSDGRSICGRCSPSTHEGPTYRQLAFETILTKTSFPCQFKEHGCEEHVFFGRVPEHEDSCPFRHISCPVLLNGACTWEGSMNQITNHFQQNHPVLVLQKIEFQIEVDHDSEGVILMTTDGVDFISRFAYSADKRTLKYDITSLAVALNGSCYKIRLINKAASDFSISLKGGDCLPYNHLFWDFRNAKELNLVNILPILDLPNEFTFAMDVVVTKTNRLQPEGQVLNVDDCGGCETSDLADGKSKEQVLCKTTISCHWEGCTLSGTSEEIVLHERVCQFRLCNCTAEACEVKKYRPDAVLAHLGSHGFHYVSDELNFKMVFSRFNETRMMFSLKLNRIIYIRHKAKKCKFITTTSYHQIMLYSLSYKSKETNSASLVLDIEHPKYKLKSEVYTLIAGDYLLKYHYLPASVTPDDQFSVTIQIL